MIILIPLGGIGKRFKDCGYKKPKALVDVKGKPILYWLLSNLNLEKVDFVYIPYNKEYLEWNLETLLRKDFPCIKFKFMPLQHETRGAAETILNAISTLVHYNKIPILCLDGDNFYTRDIITIWNGENAVFTFDDQQDKPIFSYVKCIDDGDIIEKIVEKVKISDFACTGAYGFSSVDNLRNYCQYVIDNNIRQKGEFYTSNVIKKMLENNIEFKMKKINKSEYFCLGTPDQVKEFEQNC